ncbi:hypothetical protein GUJ93_ZPchr0011g28259 [Zizania palustris]|uniref:VQ domain-containing protein n=1 Tax=Zizania palustris TaxID=103762 RepID=A0A8J6BLD5_ZIZPA|nr:hypothetical protein GUJ93_ZPchr0011g28259 [Zizania palustris]
MGRGPRQAPAKPDSEIFVTDQSTFKALVQRLTGQQIAEAVATEGDAARQTTVASVSAAGRAGATVMRPPTAVQKPPLTFKPTRPSLASFVLPVALSPSPSSSMDCPCVTNISVELLPPSPPSASTLAEEAVVDEATEADQRSIQLQERRFDDMNPSSPSPPPPLPPARNSEPQLLTLFPLTPSYIKEC